MLALRTVACSDRWRQAWRQIRKQWVQQTQAQRAATSAQRLLSQQPPQEVALPSQALTEHGSSARPISAELVGSLTKGAEPDSQTCEVLPPAESFSSTQLKQETASARDRHPAPSHPWRRPFLRQRLAC